MEGRETQFAIRWGNGADAPAIHKLLLASLAYPSELEDVYSLMKTGGQAQPTTTWVAEQPGHKGLAGVLVCQDLVTARRVKAIAVREDVRREGLGKALLWQAACHVWRPLDVCVDELDLPALKFFRACGFKAVESLPQHYPTFGRSPLAAYRLEKVKE